jgi:hypothetical protein
MSFVAVAVMMRHGDRGGLAPQSVTRAFFRGLRGDSAYKLRLGHARGELLLQLAERVGGDPAGGA